MGRDDRDAGTHMRATMFRAVLDDLGSLRGLRVLEVGCWPGSNLQLALDRGATVWGVDPSARLLQQARRRVPDADLRLGTFEELPFDSGTFDVVCSFGGLEETADPAKVARELARVCRPGGVVAISTDGTGAMEACRPFADLRVLTERAGLWTRRWEAVVISVKRDQPERSY